jgi:DNA gyrase inhibitor GyrI
MIHPLTYADQEHIEALMNIKIAGLRLNCALKDTGSEGEKALMHDLAAMGELKARFNVSMGILNDAPDRAVSKQCEECALVKAIQTYVPGCSGSPFIGGHGVSTC